ncbi:MAG TPA: hypothetical protein VFT22_32375 [Kofleriaceae bacterium]|nr:hypothetical protein [Kofleriaceae bacterium]
MDVHVEQRVATASIEQIDLWTVRILSAATLADVFADRRRVAVTRTAAARPERGPPVGHQVEKRGVRQRHAHEKLLLQTWQLRQLVTTA